MAPQRLEILFLSPFPPSPATFGAQRRIEGLLQALSSRHVVSLVTLAGPAFDAEEARQAAAAYCREVIVIGARPDRGTPKRMLQLRSLLSPHSFERLYWDVPGLQRAVDGLLHRRRFDAVCVEFPFMMNERLRVSSPGWPPPLLLLDEHNVEFDLARQSLQASTGALRRLHHAVNWRKLRTEETSAWRNADGVTFTSSDDEARARAVVPSMRSAVVPNAVDVETFRPGPGMPPLDGRTVLFFGTLGYFPNQDGMLHFLRETWPIISRARPEARLKIVGPNPTPEVLAQQGPRIEVTGLVPDLRPHLSEAAVVIVPLRIGGGTRFKILEAMSMGKAIVSTTLGAEGIQSTPGQQILLADTPADFATAVVELLDDPGRARRMGDEARTLVCGRYSWIAASQSFEEFLRSIPPAAVRARSIPG